MDRDEPMETQKNELCVVEHGNSDSIKNQCRNRFNYSIEFNADKHAL